MCEENYDILECGHFSDKLGNMCRVCISERNDELFLNKRNEKHKGNPFYTKEYKIYNQTFNFENSIAKRNSFARARAKKAGQESPASFSSSDIQQLIQDQNNCCAGCFTSFESCVMEIDHKLPIEYGGTNDIKNLQLLCKPCNVSKSRQDNAKWLSDVRYRQVISFLQELQEEESYAT